MCVCVRACVCVYVCVCVRVWDACVYMMCVCRARAYACVLKLFRSSLAVRSYVFLGEGEPYVCPVEIPVPFRSCSRAHGNVSAKNSAQWTTQQSHRERRVSCVALL